jgi:hypothetical protein
MRRCGGSIEQLLQSNILDSDKISDAIDSKKEAHEVLNN